MEEALTLEEQEALNKQNIEEFRREIDQGYISLRRASDESFQAIQAALRMVITINGGAAIAVLAYLGALASKASVNSSQAPLVATLQYFAIGVAVGAVGLLCVFQASLIKVCWHKRVRYSSQFPFWNSNPRNDARKKFIRVFTILAALCGFASIGIFLAGIWAAQVGLRA